MIDFNMRSFAGELAKIKVAQAEMAGDQPGRKRWKEVAKAVGQNVGAGLVGGAAGTALGYGAAELIRRSGIHRSIPPERLKTVRNVSGLLGTAGGLALMNAMNLAQRRIEAIPS